MIYAVVASVILGFVLSGAYYALTAPIESRALNGRVTERGDVTPVKAAVELTRTTVVALAMTWLMHTDGTDSIGEAMLLSIVLWAAFPAVLLAGSVLWENVPFITAVMHAGDWLLKLLLIGALVGWAS